MAPFGTSWPCLRVYLVQNLGKEWKNCVSWLCGLLQLEIILEAWHLRRATPVFITQWHDIWVQAGMPHIANPYRQLKVCQDERQKWLCFGVKSSDELRLSFSTDRGIGLALASHGLAWLGSAWLDSSKVSTLQRCSIWAGDWKDRLRLRRDGSPSCQDLWCICESPKVDWHWIDYWAISYLISANILILFAVSCFCLAFISRDKVTGLTMADAEIVGGNQRIKAPFDVGFFHTLQFPIPAVCRNHPVSELQQHERCESKCKSREPQWCSNQEAGLDDRCKIAQT